jgi:hypothetical protein
MVEKGTNRVFEFLQRDIFAIIWIVFIITIFYFSFYGKEFIKDMIIVSILFFAFLLIEPMVRLAHGSKITKMIARGKDVPPWKRFPMFFLAILILFALERGLEFGLDETIPTESINIILVIFWLLSLFLIYYLVFSKHEDSPEETIQKGKRRLTNSIQRKRRIK